ncbi:MAG: hypothetical protein AB1486_24635 [Planctomycetota bacterium]
MSEDSPGMPQGENARTAITVAKGAGWLVWVRRIAGIVLIVLGVIGLFLPLLQGVLFLSLGLVLLLGRRRAQALLRALKSRWRRLKARSFKRPPTGSASAAGTKARGPC